MMYVPAFALDIPFEIPGRCLVHQHLVYGFDNCIYGILMEIGAEAKNLGGPH